ncbi:hypothetical protein [Planosporangium mesophilum]|uniref:Uncharacterized protein n=1 Tax=Planosporangium mesophilum TaxID=689768 RepID=A0A8J3TDU2_9ACTN|nr:hypothetical protein [Planosporangium mesophilum]NJC84899.1 hypothetical protein [Planosporangium mesophilum]GII23636.1 hypothetical protein Pme01_32330 [Planosporangium mesophilum]
MVTWYENLLVAGEFELTVNALERAGFEAIVAPVARARVAVVPYEWSGGEDLSDMVTLLGRDLGFAAIRWENNSFVLTADVWEGGRLTHWYVSELSNVAYRWVDELGPGPSIDPQGIPLPAGPVGDPAVFARFGVGNVDIGRLAAALRGEGPSGVAPGRQHRAILEALNLDPLPLTDEFSSFDLHRLPGAVLTGPVGVR